MLNSMEIVCYAGWVVGQFIIPNEPIRVRSGQAPRGGILLKQQDSSLRSE